MPRSTLGAAIFLLVGCGGSVDHSHPDESKSVGGGGAFEPPDGAAGNPGDVDAGSGGTVGDGGSGGIYVDPGCPDAAPAEGTRECDPLSSIDTCPYGERCAPYVEYADNCGREVYGTACIQAGTGIQGDACLDASDCAARHVCVTTGEGNQCVQLCDPLISNDCPAGLLCEWYDVRGSHVCF